MDLTVPFRRYRLRLRLLHAARLHFRHEVMLHSLLSEALGRGELPESVVPFACESGRVDFARDDDYRIGFTLTASPAVTTASDPPERFMGHLARALGVYGARGFQGDRIPMLRWFGVGEPEPLAAPDLEAECHAQAGRTELALQFVSPLRLEVPKGANDRATEFFDARHFPAEAFLRLLWNRLFFLRHGRFPHRDEVALGLPLLPAISCDPRKLLWIDAPRVNKPPLGGVVGRLILQNPGASWLPLLVAGQYLHLGKSTGFGFGGYRLAGDASLWNDPFGPSQTALERVAQRERLTAASRHVVAATSAGGVDGVGPAQFTQHEDEIIGGLAHSLADGAYRPAPLLGILLPKGHSKVRALAVPTLSDRAVQRAALEIIGPAIETLLEDCSYAYRKGFSRAGAAQAIQKAYADGYRWVLDADIDSFFDAVDWERLFGKIEALYPFEPLTAILRGWVSAPVVYNGALIERRQGLPQGAVISPLLANLFLDELDEELLGNDFRLVRYADDFVVLCKDVESAGRAREAATLALARLGLALQEEKTAIRAVDHGFSYLGFLFCRSAIMEQQHPADPAADETLEHPIASPASWLAQVDLSRVKELACGEQVVQAPQVVPLIQASPAGHDTRRPLYVSDPSVRLHLRKETVVVEKEGDAPRQYPLRALSLVVFIGRPRATLPLVLELGLAGVPVFFCQRNGEIEAVHGPFRPEVDVWLAQGKAALDDFVRLAFAQEIVAAKLHNFATMTVRHALRGAEAASGEIRDLERSVWNKTEVDSVRGLEGAAAATYFRSVAATLAEEWDFDGRIKHPPGDPFNAMLSYGYTLLYHHCVAALYAAGLLPRIGLFHKGHGTWDALASDLQEELRYLIDGLVWSLVRRHEILPADFQRTGAGCWFTPAARRKFIGAFEDRMETAFTPDGEERSITYREAIGVQAMRIRDYVLGRSRYAALRAHG